VFDDAKDKAQDFAGQAKDKFGQQQEGQDDQQNESNSGNLDDLKDKATDFAKERFGNN
jgi:hypothetical protein